MPQCSSSTDEHQTAKCENEAKYIWVEIGGGCSHRPRINAVLCAEHVSAWQAYIEDEPGYLYLLGPL